MEDITNQLLLSTMEDELQFVFKAFVSAVGFYIVLNSLVHLIGRLWKGRLLSLHNIFNVIWSFIGLIMTFWGLRELLVIVDFLNGTL